MSGALLTFGVGLVLGLALVVVALLAPWRRSGRWVVGGLGVLLMASPVLLIGAFLLAQPEPLEPDATLAVGVRVDDGAARVWLGPECDSVTDLEVYLKLDGSPQGSTLELRAPEPGVAVERLGLTPETYPPGMEAVVPLPQELDLRDHHSLTVEEERAGGVLLEPVVAASADRPDEYWFGEQHGWMDLREAERQMGEGRLSSICSPAPDPER